MLVLAIFVKTILTANRLIMKANRIIYIDYIRIFACFLVMLVHASEHFYGMVSESAMAGPQSFLADEADRLWVSLYDGFSRMAVPLFMIVSAFLLVPMPQEQTSWEFYKRRIKRVVPPWAFFAILYSTLPLLWGGISSEIATTDLSRLLLNFPTMAGHFWFMYPLVGIYLFIPIISPWLRNATKREEEFFILLFLISTAMPYLNRWFGEVWGQCFWNQYHLLWNFSGYLGYLVLAHYIRVHIDWSRTKRFWIGLLTMIAGAAATIYSFYVQATPGVVHSTPVIEVGWAFCTLNCVALTFGTFLLFTCIEATSAPKAITNLSGLSFGMYLVHIFWLGPCVMIIKDGLTLPTALDIPLIAIATFICSYITIKLISFIPGSKWIIG